MYEDWFLFVDDLSVATGRKKWRQKVRGQTRGEQMRLPVSLPRTLMLWDAGRARLTSLIEELLVVDCD